ncbi:testis-expressed protein 19.2-like [Castor canadensis]
MAYLYASWMYQLLHGEPLGLCFACFKVAFLDLKDTLESDDEGDEDWDPDPLESPAVGPEQGGPTWPGPSWGLGSGQPAMGGAEFGGPGPLASVPGELGAVGLDHPFVPTELGPEEAVPLDLGPEDDDWTQALPWRFLGLPPCSHWPQPPIPRPCFFNTDLPSREPMMLEVVTNLPVDPVEMKAWFLGLQIFSMVGHYDATYFRKMIPGCVLRASDQHWKVLLSAGEVCTVKLQDAPQQPDLPGQKLSILETTEFGVELVPADIVLQKKGFKIISYSLCRKGEAEEGGSASKPKSSTQGQDPGIAENWSTGPGGSGERLNVVEASAPEQLPCFQSLSPGPQNGGPEAQAATTVLPAPEHQGPGSSNNSSSPAVVEQLAQDGDLH